MVTPGGMVLAQPRMVAATDVLELAPRGHAVAGKCAGTQDFCEDALCVELRTIGRNRHECRVGGVARLRADGTYVLGNGATLLRLTLMGAGTIWVEPVGTAYLRFCESYGRIDSARYEEASS